MSLFKLKTIWNANFPQQEFDQKHLSLGNINKTPSIAIGSYKGILRVFLKQQNPKQFFKQIIQKSFQQPIIDVQFMSQPTKNTICLLLFKKFIYLTLQHKQQQSGFSAKQMLIDCDPSFSIIPYPLSLATLNSSIQTLNPKQIHKIKQSDPIYPFASSNQNDFYYMDGEDLVKCKGNIEQWRIIIGKVRMIFIVKTFLVLIGERDLWQIEQGTIHKSKRLQEQVSTGIITHKQNKDYNIIMLIYSSEYSLLWAIKLDFLPIRILVFEQNGPIQGAMVFLTEEGALELVYAGTEIQERSLRPLEKQVNMQKVQKQTQYFLQKIRQLKQTPHAQAQKMNSEPTTNPNNLINLKLFFGEPQQTQQFIDKKQQLFHSMKNKLVKCVLNVQISAQQTQLSNVLISVIKPNNLHLKDEYIKLPIVKGKQTLKWDFFISKQKFPYHNKVKVLIRYEKGKLTKFTEQEILIPFKLQCRVDSFQAISDSDKKVKFKCTEDALPLFNELFPDIMQRGSGQQKKAITFCLANGIKTSIVYNKTLTKVKIETEIYSGFCFIFLEFMRRIQSYLQKQGKKPTVEVNEIPLKEIATQIQDYHSCRYQVKSQFKEFQTRTQEFKKSQKKLLLKMKQKNSSLQHITKLLEYTYSRVLDSAQKYENLFEQFKITTHNFEVSLRFVLEFAYRRGNASGNAIKIADGILQFDSANENALDEEGWGERIANNAAYYLNKTYQPTAENLQKLVTWVIAKINSGEWN